LRRSGRGDQIVIVQVAIPTKLSKEQENLIEQLAPTLGKEIIAEKKEKGLFDHLKDLKEALGL